MAAGFLVKGILIGLLFGIPVGAVGTLTVQRAYRYGFTAGLKTGLGSSAADCLYAACGTFGLTFLSDFLLKYQIAISIAGGCLIVGIGMRLFLKRENTEVADDQNEKNRNWRMFVSSFAVGITNPAAILTFLFAFSYFGIVGELKALQGILLMLGIFTGTFSWWFILSAIVILIKRKTGHRGFRYMNQVFGTFLILFGIAFFIRISL